MKPFFAALLFCFAIGIQAQQNPYLNIFEPNRDGTGDAFKNSPQKTVAVLSCQATGSREDSLNCLEYASTFDAKGRLTEHHELYLGLLRHYKYDDKDRVTEYTETQINTNTVVLQLVIEYDKKGRIAQLVNKAAQGAKSVMYYANDERLLVSETMGAIDEVYFKNGRIVKYINKNSAEILLYMAEYEYDKKGRLVKETGKDIIEGLGDRYTTTTVYNAQNKKESETTEFWYESNPTDKKTQKSLYFYNDAGQMYQKEKSITGGDEYMTVFEYDTQNRLLTADYFSGSTRLVTLYYYYR